MQFPFNVAKLFYTGWCGLPLRDIYLAMLHFIMLAATDGQCRDPLTHWVMPYGDILFLRCCLYLLAGILVQRQSVIPSFNIWSSSHISHNTKGKISSINQSRILNPIYLFIFKIKCWFISILQWRLMVCVTIVFGIIMNS